MNPRRHLAYTLALDHPSGATGHRTLAKLLVLSLLRTGFRGDIVVFKNSPAPLFLVPRAGVLEIEVATNGPDSDDFWHYAQLWKFRVRQHLDVRNYDKVLFLDADCLAQRDISGLLDERFDIAYYPEPGSHAGESFFNCFIGEHEQALLAEPGINGGLLAVRASHFHAVAAEWERIAEGPVVREKFFADQAALTRLVAESPLQKRALSRVELATPFSYDPRTQDYTTALLVHLAGSGELEEKLRFMFGLYLSTFFFDPQTLLLHVLET
jgi:Glycosyl transferase family 8